MDNLPSIYLASVEVSENNKAQGFHTAWGNIPEKLMLVVTELAEAIEKYRTLEISQWQDTYPGGPSNPMVYDSFVEEIADTFIRLMDICGALGLDIDKAIADKVDYNITRPYKHGKAL